MTGTSQPAQTRVALIACSVLTAAAFALDQFPSSSVFNSWWTLCKVLLFGVFAWLGWKVADTSSERPYATVIRASLLICVVVAILEIVLELLLPQLTEWWVTAFGLGLAFLAWTPAYVLVGVLAVGLNSRLGARRRDSLDKSMS